MTRSMTIFGRSPGDSGSQMSRTRASSGAGSRSVVGFRAQWDRVQRRYQIAAEAGSGIDQRRSVLSSPGLI